MGYNIFIQTLDGKCITLDLNGQGSETNGTEIKNLLSENNQFKTEDIINDYILLFDGHLFSNDHRLSDHQVTADSTLHLVKIDNKIENTILKKYKKEEFIANEPSLRLTYVISGYVRSFGVVFSIDLSKFMVHCLGNKFPTFEIMVYSKKYRVSEKWLIRNLKRKLNCTPYHNVKYENKRLFNYKTLEYYGIGYRANPFKLKYYCHQIYIKTLNGALIILDLRTVDLTILECKQALFEQENISIDTQKWISHGKVMENNKNLKFDYQIGRDTVIHLIPLKKS